MYSILVMLISLLVAMFLPKERLIFVLKEGLIPGGS